MNKNFWWIVFWAIAAISYVILLLLAIVHPQEALEPFIIMNIGALCTLPYFIARLRGQVSEPEKQDDKPETKEK